MRSYSEVKFVDRLLLPSELDELVDKDADKLRFRFAIPAAELVASGRRDLELEDAYAIAANRLVYGSTASSPLNDADFRLVGGDGDDLIVELVADFTAADCERHRHIRELSTASPLDLDRLTDEMVAAGNSMASKLLQIEYSRVLGGNSGDIRDWNAALAEQSADPDFDLMVAAADKRISNTGAMYLCMRRREPAR